MSISQAEVGLLVRDIKGQRRLGVIQSISGEMATVLFSKSGSDEVREVNISDLENPAVTEAFINELVSLNSAT